MSISCCPNPPKRLPLGDRFHVKRVYTILATFPSSMCKSPICPMFAAMTHALIPPLFRSRACDRDVTQQLPLVPKIIRSRVPTFSCARLPKAPYFAWRTQADDGGKLIPPGTSGSNRPRPITFGSYRPANVTLPIFHWLCEVPYSQRVGTTRYQFIEE